MCDLLGVSRASYYRHWQASAPRQEETELRDVMQCLALANRHYGYRRIGVLLRRQGFVVNHKRVLGLMREDNLLCLRHRPFVVMSATQIWSAAVGSRKRPTSGCARASCTWPSCSMPSAARWWAGRSMLTCGPAWQSRPCSRRWLPGTRRGMIHHSDQGTQYACEEYRLLLEQHDLQASMSRAGNPYDNAKAESFMATLKREQVDGRTYRDLAEARADIGTFIDKVYNLERLHSALGYRSPEQFEAAHQALLKQGVSGAARSQSSAPPTPQTPVETTNPAATMQDVSP